MGTNTPNVSQKTVKYCKIKVHTQLIEQNLNGIPQRWHDRSIREKSINDLPFHIG
jgi:hypothetical protein